MTLRDFRPAQLFGVELARLRRCTTRGAVSTIRPTSRDRRVVFTVGPAIGRARGEIGIVPDYPFELVERTTKKRA